MIALIPDELVDEFALRGDPSEITKIAEERFGGLVDRVALTGEAGLIPKAMR